MAIGDQAGVKAEANLDKHVREWLAELKHWSAPALGLLEALAAGDKIRLTIELTPKDPRPR